MSELDKLYEIWIRDDSAQSYSINISKACREIKYVREVVEAARKVVELAKAKPTLCADRLKALGEAIKEYEEVDGEMRS